jgi:formate dehydrogenase subunit gamma
MLMLRNTYESGRNADAGRAGAGAGAGDDAGGHRAAGVIDDGLLRQWLAPHVGQPGGLLPALHAVQDHWGHIPRSAVQPMAEAFNLSRAEVHGVISYYHHFRSEPAGRHVIQVCRAESCRSMGGEQLLAQLGERLGCGTNGHSPDGLYTVEPVYCLGLCASSPALTADGQPHARVTPARLERILASMEQDA